MVYIYILLSRHICSFRHGDSGVFGLRKAKSARAVDECT